MVLRVDPEMQSIWCRHHFKILFSKCPLPLGVQTHDKRREQGHDCMWDAVRFEISEVN